MVKILLFVTIIKDMYDGAVTSMICGDEVFRYIQDEALWYIQDEAIRYMLFVDKTRKGLSRKLEV